jgi:hypothetical protein
MLTFIVIHIYSRKYGNFLYFTKVISVLLLLYYRNKIKINI